MGPSRRADASIPKLVEKNIDRGFQRSTADNSHFFAVRNRQLLLFASWVDDLMTYYYGSATRCASNRAGS